MDYQALKALVLIQMARALDAIQFTPGSGKAYSNRAIKVTTGNKTVPLEPLFPRRPPAEWSKPWPATPRKLRPGHRVRLSRENWIDRETEGSLAREEPDDYRDIPITGGSGPKKRREKKNG